MKTKFKITWCQLMVDEIDFEENFGMTYEEFKKLTKEEKEELEQQVIDSFRDEIVPMVYSTEFLESRQ